MASTTFVNGVTLTDEDWFNDVDRVVYDILGDPAAGGNIVTTLGVLPLTGGTLTGALTLSGAPTNALHAATKTYVDDAASTGLKPTTSCGNATTANITRSGEQTIDGILTATSRILVKDQTAPAENGIYVTSAGAWARATDMDAWTEVPGRYTFVTAGTTQANTGWSCNSLVGGTLDTTAITWVQFSAPGTYTASGGITKTGSNFTANIGTDIQAYDADLTAIAGLTSAADKVPYFTGVGTAAVADLTATGRSIIDDTSIAAVKTTLGLTIGTDVQAYDAELAALAGVVSAADKVPYFTGIGMAAVTDLTAAGRALIDDVAASNQRTTLGSTTVGDAVFIAATAAAARTAIGAGTISTQASDAVSITGGTITGITDLTVADGGTGRSTGTTAYALVATGTTATGVQQTLANGATTEVLVGGGAVALPVWTTATGSGAPVRATSPVLVSPELGTPASGVATNLTGTASGLTAGNVTTNANLTGPVTSSGNATTIADAELAALAGLTSAVDSLPYFTGSGTASLATFTAAGRALVDDADAAAQRATLGITVPGLTYLNSGSVSAAATLDIVMTTYTTYANKLLVVNLIPVTDNVTLGMRFSTDGGSTYDAGALDYRQTVAGYNDAGGSYLTAGAGNTMVIINGDGIEGIGNAVTEGCEVSITLHDMTSTTKFTRANWKGSFMDSLAAGSRHSIADGGGTRVIAQDTDAIRLFFLSGNISSGSWRLYGFN